MSDKEKIKLLEKQIKLLEKVIELQRLAAGVITVPIVYPHVPYGTGTPLPLLGMTTCLS